MSCVFYFENVHEMGNFHLFKEMYLADDISQVPNYNSFCPVNFIQKFPLHFLWFFRPENLTFFPVCRDHITFICPIILALTLCTSLT